MASHRHGDCLSRMQRRAAITVVVLASLGVLPTLAGAAPQRVPPAGTIVGYPVRLGQRARPTVGATVIGPRGASAALYARQKRAAAARAAAEANLHRLFAPQSFGPAVAIIGTLNATGLSAAQQIAAGGVNETPPDTTGAIGPNHYVEFNNSEVIAFNRVDLTPAGAAVDMSTFVAGTSACDPQIKFDPKTNRWFYVAIRCDGTTTTNQLYIGFSKTSDPTNFSTAASGGWCGYFFNFGPNFEDYPKLAVDGTRIVVGVNEFQSASPFAFRSARIFIATEPAAGTITTCPFGPTFNGFGSAGTPLTTSVSGHMASTPEPVMVADNTTGSYVVAADEATPFSGSGSNIMVWQITGSPGTPVLSALGAPSVTPFLLPASIPQPGTTDPIDSSDSRLTAAVAATDPAIGSEAIWTHHVVDSGSGGTVLRWYEIVPGSLPTVRQAGTITDPSGWVFGGAIAPTTNGGAIANYNVGGPNQLVTLVAQARLPSTPLGSMTSPITLASSAAIDTDFSCPSQPRGIALGRTSCRWGDYAGASLDPTNGSAVWGTGELNGPIAPVVPGVGHKAQWATQNFALTTDLAPNAAFTAPATVPVNRPVVFNGAGSTDPDGSIASYAWTFGDGSAAGTGPAPMHSYAALGSFTVTLTVTDNGGVLASVSHQVVVDESPVAAFVVKTAHPGSGAPVQFNGSGSKDPDGSIVAFAWSFGDGSANAAGVAPKHTFKHVGSYHITLTVTDTAGLTASTTSSVVVKLGGVIGRVKILSGKKGTFLLIKLNAPGVLTVRGHKFKIKRAESLKVKITLTPAEKTKLNRHHKLKLRVTIKFVPTAGNPSTKTVTITLHS
jgi:PKD repeat protein